MSVVYKSIGLNVIKRSSLLFRETRFYHPTSTEYVKSKKIYPLTYEIDSIQSKILSDCLQNEVPRHGFTEKAITATLNRLGYDSTMLSILGSSNSPSIFQSSPAVMELVKFNLVNKRYQLTEGIDSIEKKESLPSLESLLLKRLEMDKPLGPHLTNLFSQLAIPSKLLLDVALPELFRLSDDMIYFSNEKDYHDMAWYTKRLGVSMSYITSKLFMAQDKSPNCEETMEFARKKLNKIMTLGDYYNNVEEYAWYTLMVSVNLLKAQFSKH